MDQENRSSRGSAATHYVSTFYHFKKLENLEVIKSDLENKAAELNIRGLLILGHEGINTTCSADSLENMNTFKNWIQDYFECHGLFFKDSSCQIVPFRRYKVKIREEIVTTGIPEMMPPKGKNNHLTPDEWNKMMKEDNDHVLIDTRNWYEYKIGTFKNAINPNIEKFTEFPEFIEAQGIPKDKKLMIFCTGGIRCEKGILELQKQGYENVYQLEGGIINYIAQHPNDQYEGECFVFDHRVALDQNLQPTQKYGLCPHCGQPSEKKITCVRCDSEQLICVDCSEKQTVQETCSKNCANQWLLHPGKKGARQILPFELEKMKSQGLDPDKIPVIKVSKKKEVRLNPLGQATTVSE